MFAYYVTAVLVQSRKRNKTGLVLAVRVGWKVARWLFQR